MNHIIYNNYINNIFNKLKYENCITFYIKEINNSLEIYIEIIEPEWYKNLDENAKINVIEEIYNYYRKIKINTYIQNNNIKFNLRTD